MARLIPVYVDFETFWSPTHSLSKMNPIVYSTHPETEIISCAAKVNGEATNVSFGEPTIIKQFKNFDWSDKLVIAHNMSGFDAMLCAWRLGVKPAMWGCTLAMARPIHAKTTGLSLAKLVEHYGIGVKNNAALLNTKGRHLKDFTPEEIEAMRIYNRDDTEQCAALFAKLLPLTTKREMKLIDMTIRMLTEPKFVLDTGLLEKTLATEKARKHEMLLNLARSLGVGGDGMSDGEIADAVGATLGSAPKFSELLESLGVSTPMKVSPSDSEKMIPALAKSDEEFIALQEHDNPVVALAASARLGIKSTLLESRVESFLAIGQAMEGKMPVPINYYGADTTGRDSGAFKINLQNMPRVNPKNPKLTDALRHSLRAPSGYKVVVSDLSGIELRVNHFLWQVPSSMALYQADPEKADLYKDFASMLYSIPVEEVSKDARQMGKVAQLGLGFGAGYKTFVRVAKMMGGVDITVEESQGIVTMWRAAYKEIVTGWKQCGAALKAIAQGAEFAIDPWGLCKTCEGGIKTPQGMIRYPDLRQVTDVEGKLHWKYGTGRHETFLTGPKVCENIVQHLAREVIMDDALRIKKELGFSTDHRVHDELIYVVPAGIADITLDSVQEIMRTPPTWWPELKVWSEGSFADTYGEAK